MREGFRVDTWRVPRRSEPFSSAASRRENDCRVSPVCPEGYEVRPPVSPGSTQATASFVHVYVLVVLGTFVCALILSCLVKR